MNKELLNQIIKDKYYDYLKDNSYWIKMLYRNPLSYNDFKTFIKEKYHLRVTDKISNVIDDIELIGSVIDTIK